MHYKDCESKEYTFCLKFLKDSSVLLTLRLST